MAKNEKKVKELKEYRLTRGGDMDKNFFSTLTSNLLINLSKRNNRIHKLLKFYKVNSKPFDEDLRIDTGNYICSLITCWESFFRDMFIFLCNHDPQIKRIFESKHQGEDLLGLTIGEYAAMRYSFQNLNLTREAFDMAFGKTTTKFTQYLDADLFSNMVFTTRLRIMDWVTDTAYLDLIDKTLAQAFNIRHKLTHDANYLLKFDQELFADIEEVFQTLPQILMQVIASKYNMNRTVFNTLKLYLRQTDTPDIEEKPYIFSAAEFMADDWGTVEQTSFSITSDPSKI